MNNQVIHAHRVTTSGRDTTSGEPFTQAVELIVNSEPDLRAELQSLVLEHIDQQGQSATQETVEELLRKRCESHAGLDINANDMLTRLARELLLHAFSNVNWRSLAEKLVEK